MPYLRSDELKCEACGEQHKVLYLHSRCHPSRPLYVSFNQEHAMLIAECSECGKTVGRWKITQTIEP